MQVKLINKPTLEFVDNALGLCWNKGCYSNPIDRDNRIKKNALKLKHQSVLEFATFIFDIEASTKVLLEMSRHRVSSYACKSSRYTLNRSELVFEPTKDAEIDEALSHYKKIVLGFIESGKSNEVTSLMLPQAYQYKWTAQFNARSLQNFFNLRRAKSAHFQIREVAEAMYDCIPDDMKYLFDDLSVDED